MNRSLVISAALLLGASLYAQTPETCQMVDLGLSVKWAGYNIGAQSPEEYGDYFAWGEISPKGSYTLKNYKFCLGTYESMTKYCYQPFHGVVDNRMELEKEDDAAHVLWGDGWRIPSKEEFEELWNRCKWKGIAYKGVNGFIVTGPNGKSIFIPKAGNMDGKRRVLQNSYGFYYTRKIDGMDSNAALGYYFLAGKLMRNVGLLREYGRPIRAVYEAGTAASLFWRSDSLQVKEIYAVDNKQYSKVGHHGPAVENSMMGLRIYFNDSGAIDVYSKAQPGLELEKYLWYPTDTQMAEERAGCDEYFVGKSLGLGGIALWDGEKMVRLEMTKGRKALVGKTANGHFAEVISYGVPYKGALVDISIRIDVEGDSRFATVSAKVLNGRKVQFVTGVNYNEGAQINMSVPGVVSVWGKHPVNVSQNPIPIGGGMLYDTNIFPTISKEAEMIRIISIPTEEVSTKVISASVKEQDMNSDKFFECLER